MQVNAQPELTVLQYIASLDLNPENVYYQRIAASSVSTSQAQWQIITPDTRSLLLSYAQVEWRPTYERQVAPAGAASNFIESVDQISLKPIMPFTNAMQTQTVRVNGNTLSFASPENFMENLSRMLVGRGEARACYDNQWWDGMGGNYSHGRNAWDVYAAELDEGLRENERLFKAKAAEALNPVLAPELSLDGQSLFRISTQEPLIVPPFNPFAKVKSGMPDYMPFKWMSPVIPNIKSLDITCNFNSQKLAAQTTFFRYGRSTDAVQRDLNITALEADLLVYWYQPPPTMSIPRAPVLQTWNMKETVSTQVIPALANTATVQGHNTQLLQLQSVPGWFICHARRDQSAAAYVCRNMVNDSDLFGANPSGSIQTVQGVSVSLANAAHSLDSHLELSNVRIQFGSKPDTINTQFSQRQLYELTLKNSKYNDFSLDYNHWKGGMVKQNNYTALVANLNEGVQVADGLPAPVSQILLVQGCKCFLAIQPKDLSNRISGGVRYPISFFLTCDLRARDGACGQRGGTQTYKFYVHEFVNKHWLRLEQDRAQYEEQAVLLDAAERITIGPGVSSASGDSGGAYMAKF